MTAIIAIKDGKRIMIGADGYTSNDTYGWPIANKELYKIQRVNGSPNCLIACAGDCDRNFAIKNIPNLLDSKDDVNFNFIVNKVLPKIYKTLKDLNYIKTGDKYNQISSSVIIATKSHLFKISGYGIVIEADTVTMCGSGEDMLYCKYQQINDDKISAEAKIVECLKHAIKYGQSIGYPITILENSINSDIKIWRE